MKVCTITNRKGGCGKSTIAVNLAAALGALGRRVVLIDMDTQGTVSHWSDSAEARGEDTGFSLTEDVYKLPLESSDEKSERRRIEKLFLHVSEKYDYILIDTPPSNDATVKIPAMIADVALVPISPSPLDLWAAVEVVELLRHAQKARGGAPIIGLVPSMVDMRTGHGKAMEDVLAGVGEYTTPPIRRRVALIDSAVAGKTIIEHQPWGPAAEEFTALAKWLVEVMEVDNG